MHFKSVRIQIIIDRRDSPSIELLKLDRINQIFKIFNELLYMKYSNATDGLCILTTSQAKNNIFILLKNYEEKNWQTKLVNNSQK